MKNIQSIFLSGHSAGAQLNAMILASDWFNQLPLEDKSLFEGVFLLAGVYDLLPLLQTTVNDPLKTDENEANANSPLKLNSFEYKTLKVYLRVGEWDTPAFISQTQAFAEKVSTLYFRIMSQL